VSERDEGEAPLSEGTPHEKSDMDNDELAAHLNHALAVQGALPVGRPARSAPTGVADRKLPVASVRELLGAPVKSAE
jgi:hypothetical protein